MNFNYKINKNYRYIFNNQTFLNYCEYVKFCNSDIPNNVIQTLAFDFDNNPRLVKPDKSSLSTICVNNYHFMKIKLIKLLLDKYNNINKNNNMILINSLNEWGEKMAIEPSNEIGYYYLNLIHKYL